MVQHVRRTRIGFDHRQRFRERHRRFPRENACPPIRHEQFVPRIGRRIRRRCSPGAAAFGAVALGCLRLAGAAPESLLAAAGASLHLERRREAPDGGPRIIRAHRGKPLEPRRRLRVRKRLRQPIRRLPCAEEVVGLDKLDFQVREFHIDAAGRGREHDAILLRRFSDLSSSSAACAADDAPPATWAPLAIQWAATAAVSDGCSD